MNGSVADEVRQRPQGAPLRQRGSAAGRCTATSAEARPDAAWDALVEATLGGDLVQTTAWAASRQRLGYRVRHIRLCAADGSLVGGCLIQFRPMLPGIWIGAVPRGPLVFTDEPGMAEQVVQEMVSAARQLGIRLLVVQPPSNGPQLRNAMALAGFCDGGPNIVPSATIRLDLQRPAGDLLRAMKGSRRRLIQNIAGDGFETIVSDDVETFHRIYAVSAQRQGFPPITLENLRAQWGELSHCGMCMIFVTRHEGRPVAVEWFTRFGDTLTLKLRGYDTSQSGPAARNAPTASLWGAMMQGREAGWRYMDLGGFDRARAEEILAGQKPPPEFGMTHGYFKWSFGGEVMLLQKPQFIFPNRIARLAFAAVAQRLLASPVVQRIAQRMRAAH
jgi:lipid II:glycine glycyltransferase (peptidoglycan interpeptide bridge formation enzyme)